MTRLAPAALIAIWLVNSPTRWTLVGVEQHPRTGCQEKADAAIDPRSLVLIREEWVQDQLGLDAKPRAEIARCLALTLEARPRGSRPVDP